MEKRRVLILVLTLVLVVSIMGCGGASGNQDREDKTVVAKVNGEKITKEDFNALYNQIKQNYYITEDMENDSEQRDTIDEIKSGVLEQLISEKVMTQNANNAGFVVTDDVLEEAGVEFENIILDVAEQMRAMDEQLQGDKGEDADNQDKDYSNEAKAYIEEQLKALGQTQDEFIALIAKQMVVDRYIEDLVKDVHADDDEIKAYYEERLKSQKENIASIAYEDVELYEPEAVRVKHILIQLPDEEIDEYVGLMGGGKEEEAKKYLDEKLKGIEPRATEVLEKANDGEVFEKLIEEYGQDPGMEINDIGYIVRQDGSFVPEFEEASFNLNEGDISDLVATRFGYHIIKLYEKIADKTYSLDEKYDEVKDAVDQQKKADAWTLILEDWMDKAKIKKYEKRI